MGSLNKCYTRLNWWQKGEELQRFLVLVNFGWLKANVEVLSAFTTIMSVVIFHILFIAMLQSSICAKIFACSSCAASGFTENIHKAALPLYDILLNTDTLCFSSCLSISPFFQLKPVLRCCFMFYRILYTESTPRYYCEIKQSVYSHQYPSLLGLQMHKGGWVSLLYSVPVSPYVSSLPIKQL